MQEIRVWFSRTTGLSLDTILPFISRLMGTGYYSSRLKLHAKGEELSLYFTDGSNASAPPRELPNANLQDLVCGMTIFISQDTIKKDNLSELTNFVHLYKKAQEVHKLRLLLEDAGHPDYQGIETSLNVAGRIHIEFVKGWLRVAFLLAANKQHATNLSRIQPSLF